MFHPLYIPIPFPKDSTDFPSSIPFVANPICSMFGIFTNICPENHPNVVKYTIHGAYGNYTPYDVTRFFCQLPRVLTVASLLSGHGYIAGPLPGLEPHAAEGAAAGAGAGEPQGRGPSGAGGEGYPLVNIQNLWKSPLLMGKSTINGHFQ